MTRTLWLAVAVGVLAMAAGSAWAEEPKPLPQAKPEEVEKAKAAMPEKAIVKPEKARKLLIFSLAKGFPHDSIPIGAEAIKMLGEKTGAWEGTISTDLQMFSADKLKDFDGVFMNNTTGNNLIEDKELRASLVEFVKGGKGIAGCHSSTDCLYEWKDYGDMLGGYFCGHPFGHISVRIDDPKSPLTAMFDGKGFEFNDEIYTFKDPYSREKLHILLSIDWDKFKPFLEQQQAQRIANDKKKLEDPKTSDADKPKIEKDIVDAGKYFDGLPRTKDNDYALSWIHEYGKGRAFYCAFGHVHEVFWNKTILAHFLAGIQYALGDLKADATPTAKITPAIEAAPGPDLIKK